MFETQNYKTWTFLCSAFLWLSCSSIRYECLCVCMCFCIWFFFDRLFLLLLMLLLLCFWSLILNKAHIGLMFRISSLNAIFPTSSFIPVYFGDLLCMLYVRISTMCTTNSTHNTNIRAWNCFFMSMCVCVCVNGECVVSKHMCMLLRSLTLNGCVLFFSHFILFGSSSCYAPTTKIVKCIYSIFPLCMWFYFVFYT